MADYSWTVLLKQLGHNADNAADRIRHKARERFGFKDRLHIIPYIGYGNQQQCFLQGRVLEQKDYTPPAAESLWHNLQQSYRRFNTDEVPHVAVRAQLLHQSLTTQTDGEGYFYFEFETPELTDAKPLEVQLTLPDHLNASDQVMAQVIVPPENARFGVISDIDDTVIITEATSLLKMMRLTLLDSARDRTAFPGVSAFYQSLHQQVNPFFYVSSSPWNLYEFLSDFMQLNNLVPGPLLLRDFGIDEDKFIVGTHADHKLEQMRKIITTYPHLSFILVGDSGQQDPEIQRTICTEFPQQILSCYIRDVSGEFRDHAVQEIITSLDKEGIDMLLVPDTLAAANHAAQHGYIETESLSEIQSGIGCNMADLGDIAGVSESGWTPHQ